MIMAGTYLFMERCMNRNHEVDRNQGHGLPPEEAGPAIRIHCLVLPGVHVMDLGGPIQAFFEANGFGGRYEISFCGIEPRARCAQGFWISDLEPLPQVKSGEMILIPGIDSSLLDNLEKMPLSWLQDAYKAGARFCSICSGAFVLGHAGLLDGRQCTTHWKLIDRLARACPKATVLANRLFARDQGVTSSAGVASGIDTALSMIEEDFGPLTAAQVAREMVIYFRRDANSTQKSIYVDYRTHLHPGVHKVQDWLIHRVDERPSLEELAGIGGMSPRNLTRLFKQTTGITLKEFSNELKLEVAANLLRNPEQSLEEVASQCGFQDSRQIRRLWLRRYGKTPSTWRAEQLRRSA
jgi:transcriptional regulator GlxA family with amidase domain